LKGFGLLGSRELRGTLGWRFRGARRRCNGVPRGVGRRWRRRGGSWRRFWRARWFWAVPGASIGCFERGWCRPSAHATIFTKTHFSINSFHFSPHNNKL